MPESALVVKKLDENGVDKRPREARKTKDSTLDRIWKFYHDKKRQVDLTPEEDHIRDRMEKAWFLLCEHKNLKEVSESLEKQFNVKKSVAWDDIRKAMLLFGDPRDDMKDAKRAIAETMILKGAEKAWNDKNLDAYYRFIKEYKEINMLNVEDDKRIAEVLKKMRPVQVVFVATREQLTKQADDLMKGIPTVDTSYEEVDEEEAED